jgi:hypothetical protein
MRREAVMRNSLPLNRFPLVDTCSIEEASALQSSINSRMDGVRIDRRIPFRWQANRLCVDSLSIVASKYASGVHGWTGNVDGHYSMLVPRNRAIEVAQARSVANLVPGRGSHQRVAGTRAQRKSGRSRTRAQLDPGEARPHA